MELWVLFYLSLIWLPVTPLRQGAGVGGEGLLPVRMAAQILCLASMAQGGLEGWEEG